MCLKYFTFHPPIRYILGDMILPSSISILSNDSSPNRTPWENCYFLGYEGPNEICQDFPEKTQNLIFVIKFSDPEYETVTHGSLYNFYMLNSHETGHLGNVLISPNW